MSRILALVMLAACGGGTPSPHPLQPCKPAVADFTTAPIPKQRSACLSTTVQTRPAAIADVLAKLDWSNADTVRAITSIDADRRSWLAVAKLLGPRKPRGAFLLLENKVEGSPDRELETVAALTKLKLARTLNDTTAVTAQQYKLVALAGTDSLDKLAIVGALAGANEVDTIAAVCGYDLDPRLAWACIESNPDGLPRYLDALAALPVLSFGDAERLTRAGAARHLDGLACISKSEFAPRIHAALSPATGEPLAGAATLYYRLHAGAPVPIAQCLLQHASRACLALLERGRACPVQYALAEYAKLLELKQQAELIKALITKKNLLHRLLQQGVPVRGVLFHLHLNLAEILVGHVPRDHLWLPQWHLRLAAEFYARGDDSPPLAALLSPELRTLVCEDPERQCRDLCVRRPQEQPPFAGCTRQCVAASTTLSAMCAMAP